MDGHRELQPEPACVGCSGVRVFLFVTGFRMCQHDPIRVNQRSQRPAANAQCGQGGGLERCWYRHAPPPNPSPTTPDATPSPYALLSAPPLHRCSIPTHPSHHRQSAHVDFMTTDIQNLKSFDPFAEADDAGGEVKSTQQNYIHIRIQRMYTIQSSVIRSHHLRDIGATFLPLLPYASRNRARLTSTPNRAQWSQDFNDGPRPA